MTIIPKTGGLWESENSGGAENQLEPRHISKVTLVRFAESGVDGNKVGKGSTGTPTFEVCYIMTGNQSTPERTFTPLVLPPDDKRAMPCF